MKRLAEVLRLAVVARLRELGVPETEWDERLRWLRFYLDFCFKYAFPPRDSDSLEPFLQKMAAKGQGVAEQRMAADSVGHYYALMKTWGARAEAAPADRVRGAWQSVLDAIKAEIRLRQYSPKTGKAYAIWTDQFRQFLADKDPSLVDSDDARRYLTHLAVERHVVASTQNQAFNALLFVFRHIWRRPYELGDTVQRARRTRYIPVVLSREEVDAVVAALEPPCRLPVQLLYGCGLRLAECLNLRVQCLNFDQGVLTIHDGKGRKDRTVPLPKALRPDLTAQLEAVRALHEKDLRAGYHGVFMPGALDRKWRHAPRELVWQWLFPATGLTYVPETGEHRRYHLHESVFQKALFAAVRKAGLTKRVTAHTFRHTFASHLLRANYDIRTIQQLLGHSDLRTTMIYTHTVQSRTLKEASSPLDFSAESLRFQN
jgi:integron integrase